MIAIIDYGLGNLNSIRNMLKLIGCSAKITSSPTDIEQASHIILPGVGAFDVGMSNLHNSGLVPLLEQRALIEKTPVLGICLGMQLLTNGSEEGVQNGLGWIPGKTIRFKSDGMRIPHMGWNSVVPAQAHPILKDWQPNDRYYFVHSYYVVPECSSHVLMNTNYGGTFASAICRENIIGMQFHPEKSHKYGVKLLQSFTGLLPC